MGIHFEILELQKILLEVSFCVMPFSDFVAAVDQDILRLTQEFVEHVIAGSNNRSSNEIFFKLFSSVCSELNNDDPKSYSIKEQLILMLPSSTGVKRHLFDNIGC